MSSQFDLFDRPDADEPGPKTPVAREPAEGRAKTVFSVSDLTANIRNLLESEYAQVWVEAEISNCRLWNTGHLYFTLKDPGAQIKAVMFRSDIRTLKFRPEDGLHVVVRGRISVYDPKGEYQLICERMEPHGLGALQLAFDQLKRRLQAEGLFDAARKRALPALPRKIGIVTSLDGAAIRDIIKVLGRRYPNAHLVIRPARVQGEGAAGEIARGLRDIVKVPSIDVVIVGRGGGSVEDLWAFNEEVVARAIAASPVPVISAVGHEVDVTIADFAADVRAPTPSAAAEIVVARKEDFCTHIERLNDRLTGCGAHLDLAPRIARASARSAACPVRFPRTSGDARPPFGGDGAPPSSCRASRDRAPQAQLSDTAPAAGTVRLAPPHGSDPRPARRRGWRVAGRGRAPAASSGRASADLRRAARESQPACACSDEGMRWSGTIRGRTSSAKPVK